MAEDEVYLFRRKVNSSQCSVVQHNNSPAMREVLHYLGFSLEGIARTVQTVSTAHTVQHIVGCDCVCARSILRFLLGTVKPAMPNARPFSRV